MQLTGTFQVTGICCKRSGRLLFRRWRMRSRRRSPGRSAANPRRRNRHERPCARLARVISSSPFAETGLFRTAFLIPDPVEDDVDASKTGKNRLNPFQLLGSALDLLVETGVLPRE